MRVNVCKVLLSRVPRFRNASLCCRENTIAEGLKAAGRPTCIELIDWPQHCVHYRKLDCETSDEPGASSHDQGTGDVPPESVDLTQAGTDADHAVPPSSSRAAHGPIDKVPVCISYLIKGSGAQPLTKGIMKAALITLCFRTFSLSQVRDTDTYTVIPATRNQGLGFPCKLLVPVYTGSAPGIPRRVNRVRSGSSQPTKACFAVPVQCLQPWAPQTF